MQFLICALFGAVLACALATPYRISRLGFFWLLVTGVGAAVLPHSDALLVYTRLSTQLMYQNSLSWSLILGPLIALLWASMLSVVSRKAWSSHVYVSCIAFGATLLLALFTSRGIQIFAPFSQWPFALDVIHTFDWGIVVILTVTLVLSLVFQSWRRHLAAAGLAGLLCYLGYVVLLRSEAKQFAENYAASFELDVAKIHVLPQPLSPANWRVIVETTDDKLHDTLINLDREQRRDVGGAATRAARIDALYKPRHEAVWRVYRRFGHRDAAFAQRAFLSIAAENRYFRYLSRFWVAETKLMVNSNPCVQFRDLTKDGSRAAERFKTLICREGNSAVLYHADHRGYFARLDIMY